MDEVIGTHRVSGTAYAVPVGLSRADARHEDVPADGVVIRQRDLGFRACPIEQAQGLSATLEAIAKLVPAMPSCSPGVAPSGNGLPGSAWAARGSGTAPAAVVVVVCILVIAGPFLLGRSSLW